MKPFLFDKSASKSHQKPKQGWLLGPTTDRDHSDQRFFTKVTLLKLLIIIGKSDLLTKVPKMWMSCNLTCVTSLLKLEKKMVSSTSMYDLISGLSLYLEREHGFTDKLVSGEFRAVRNTLDNVIKERNSEGVGGGLKGPYLGRT